MATQKKIDTVNALSEKISKAHSIIFADYTGLKHKQIETLRKALKKIGAEFIVVKNKLLERSLGEQAESVTPLLKESTAVLFNYEDEVAGLKELFKFFKLTALGKTKGGLPGKQELLGQLAGQLMVPLSGLHYALSWNINRLVWGLSNIKNKR